MIPISNMRSSINIITIIITSSSIIITHDCSCYYYDAWPMLVTEMLARRMVEMLADMMGSMLVDYLVVLMG